MTCNRIQKLVAFVGAASAAVLSSCTLPADQAWRKIKDDGLIAYWSYELKSPHANSEKPSGPPRATAAAPQIAQAQTRPSPVNLPGMLDTGRPLTAHSIPSLPGFVRSPYTNPPRLVDVKGATPGNTMICPYTQRAFIIPADFANASMVVDADTRSSESTPAAEKKSSIAGIISETLPKVVINNHGADSAAAPANSQPKPNTEPSPAPVASNSTPAPAVSPAAGPKPVQEIPFGGAIQGRPGFVNSPFAAKHQLVDVTGLPTGMEVKCPYTGKLFRVPPQDVASSKPAETAPLTSPEEPKKK